MNDPVMPPKLSDHARNSLLAYGLCGAWPIDNIYKAFRDMLIREQSKEHA